MPIKKTPALHAEYPVGTLVHATLPSSVNVPGEVGFVADHFVVGECPAIGILFESGGYHGWTEVDLRRCFVMALTPPDGPHRPAARYQFRSAHCILREYRCGAFLEWFGAARGLVGNADRVH